MARWATAASVPVEFVKCVSAAEVTTRLRSGRRHSALLVGGDVVGLDRDLIDAVAATGAPTIVVAAGGGRDWTELGAAAVLPSAFDRRELLSALGGHAPPIERVDAQPSAPPLVPQWRGRLLAVTGPGGTGASITAMSIAQAFGREDRRPDGSVVLADLRLDAEQGMLHDTRALSPGVQELVESHRGGRLTSEQIRSLTFDASGRGYHLLLGLRRHRDWTAIRARAFAASIDGLRAAYSLVVADVGADVEGEEATGSADVEDRNLMAREVLRAADAVVVVGNPTTKGTHSLARLVRTIVAEEIAPERIVPVFARAPRGPRRRAEAVRALTTLLDDGDHLGSLGNPVFLADRSEVETALRDGRTLPPQLGRPLHAELLRRLERAPVSASPTAEPEPQRVAPGSIGHWSGEAG
jgi:MinD-like ATPase involved in chromosome partitioning or flagellar assembly